MALTNKGDAKKAACRLPGMLWLVLVLAGTAATQPSADSARDSLPAKVVPLPGIIVKSQRISFPLTTVPAAATVQLSRLLPQEIVPTPQAVIDRVPGMRSVATGNQWGRANLDVRGFYGAGQAQYLLVTYERIPLNEFTSGLVNIAEISLLETEAFESVKGPVSAQYGDFGFGGLIALRATSFDPENRGTAELSAASDEGWSAGGRLNFQTHGVGVNVVPSIRTNGGWRQHSEYDSRRVVLSLGTREKQSRWTALATLSRTTEEMSGALTSEQIDADRTQAATDLFGRTVPDERRTTSLALGLSSAVPLARSMRLHPMAYVRLDQSDNVVSVTSSLRHEPTQFATGGELAISADRALAGRLLQLASGLIGDYGRLSTEYREFEGPGGGLAIVSGTGERVAVAGYVHAAYHPVDWCIVSLGGRFDYIHTSFTHDESQLAPQGRDQNQEQRAFSPKVAVSVHPTGDLSLYGSVASAFKAPTLVHLYDSPPIFYQTEDSMSGYLVISNRDLAQMTGTNFETGVRYFPHARVSVSIDGYWFEIRNEIDFDPRLLRYANAGLSRHRGLEVLAEFSPADNLTMRLEGAYTNAVFLRAPYEGKQVNGVPRWRYGMETTARISRSLSLSGRVIGQSRQFLDQPNSSKLGDYATLGVGASYEFGRFRARLGVFNVLDTEFNSDGYIGMFGEERLYPAAGRHFSLTLQSRL